MSPQDNIALVRRLYDEVYCKPNPQALDQFCDQNVKLKDPALPNSKSGLQALKQLETEYNKAFPDKKTTIDEIFSTDDHVFVSWTCTGNNKGSLIGIPPSNKTVKITGVSFYKIENGKITEINQCWDCLGLLQQIGGLAPAEALH